MSQLLYGRWDSPFSKRHPALGKGRLWGGHHQCQAQVPQVTLYGTDNM
jgi:hypothetical protein